MKNILVAVDGSKNSKKALEKTVKLANLADSKVTIMYVINDMINTPYIQMQEHKEAIDGAFLDQAKVILEESKEYFKGEDIEVETLIRHGDPGSVIIEESEEDCDLIIMGSRGLNAISRAMLGSVSQKVLNHSNKSVLIVK